MPNPTDVDPHLTDQEEEIDLDELVNSPDPKPLKWYQKKLDITFDARRAILAAGVIVGGIGAVFGGVGAGAGYLKGKEDYQVPHIEFPDRPPKTMCEQIDLHPGWRCQEGVNWETKNPMIILKAEQPDMENVCIYTTPILSISIEAIETRMEEETAAWPPVKYGFPSESELIVSYPVLEAVTTHWRVDCTKDESIGSQAPRSDERKTLHRYYVDAIGDVYENLYKYRENFTMPEEIE